MKLRNRQINFTLFDSHESINHEYYSESSSENEGELNDELMGLMRDNMVYEAKIESNEHIKNNKQHTSTIDTNRNINANNNDSYRNSNSHNLTMSIESIETSSEEDDYDYNPLIEKENQENEKKLRQLSKCFAFSNEDKTYYKSLNMLEKDRINSLFKELTKKSLEDKPVLFKILESKLPLDSKLEILRKYKETKSLDKSSSEYYKVREYLDGILDIPFNKFNDLYIENTESYILQSKKSLDSIIFGHEKVKIHILEILGQYLSAPKSIGNVFGIYGPMGIGKTTIIKEGLSKVLQRPFNFITLGGASDAAFLDGHGYTYEGSKHGKILECLIKSKCMNPIFYFDELDKISTTAKGEEITNMLIHLTDDSQNCRFQDKYYSGIDIDLSRAIFVFSFNNINKVNPILRDRLNIIKLEGFSIEDKFTISNDFLIKNILKEFDATNINFTNECLRYIISEYSKEEGVRELKRKIKDIVSRLNLIKLSNGSIFSHKIPKERIAQNPINIDISLAKRLLM